MGGWGIRPSDWGFVASVQQQILPRTAVEFSYSRRWLNGFTVTDNLCHRGWRLQAVQHHGANGFAIGSRKWSSRSTNLFNVTQAAAVLAPNNFNEPAANVGNQYQHFNGFLLNVSSRVRGGLTLSGGVMRARPSATTARFARPFRSSRWPASCPPPVRASTRRTRGATSTPVGYRGARRLPATPSRRLMCCLREPSAATRARLLAANYTIPLATAQAGGLVGPYANGVSPTVNLVQPGTLYGDRVNELDFKVAKILRFGSTRTNIGLEVFNLMNSNAGADLQPGCSNGGAGRSGVAVVMQVLTARFLKFSATFDFLAITKRLEVGG